MYSMCLRLNKKRSSMDQEKLTIDDDDVSSYMSVPRSKPNRVHRSIETLFKRSRARISTEIQTALFFGFLLFFFIVTWTPMFVLDIFVYVGRPVSDTAVNVAVLLSHCNSSFNPFLYRFRSDFGYLNLWICTKNPTPKSRSSSTDHRFTDEDF